MKYKNICTALSLLAIPAAYASAASFVINEVMYDLKEGSDGGREWVEVLNSGSVPLDLSTFKLFESGTAHSIKSVQGNAAIPPGGYGVIADIPDKFLVDNPGFTGNLFDSTFSLSNTGETISIKDSTNAVIDTLTYDSTEGGAGDGSTLGKIGGSFTSTNSTPGSINTAFSGAPDLVNSSQASSAATSTSSVSDASDSAIDTVSSVSESLDTSTNSFSGAMYSSGASTMNQVDSFKVGAGRERLVSVHTPVVFSGLPTSKLSVLGGTHTTTTYQWSFGDGLQAYGPIVEHTYLFPGEYNVVLVAEDASGAQITSRTKVFVRQGGVALRDVFLAQNGYIALSNLNKEEVNIGGWIISIDKDRIVLPQDTILSSQSTLRFSYSWPSIPETDLHKTMRDMSQEKIDSASSTSLSDLNVMTIPNEIELNYPDGTLAATTTNIQVDPSIDSKVLDSEKRHQISLIQNALAILRAELVKAFSLSASSIGK